MSGRIVGRVHERIVGNAPRKAVLLCLADHANPDGAMSFPSVDRIAQETELGESTVRQCLAWLREKRLIVATATHGAHKATTYRVNLEALSDLQVVEVYRPGLQQVASRPPGGGVRPPGGGGEPSLTVSEPSAKPAVSPPRPRDPLFDAITTTCRVDPATAGSGIAKAKQRLTKAAPPYTAEDVAAFGRWWVKQYGADRPPTVWQLAERIGVIRTAAAKPSLGMYFED